jgi:hypothetical protein
VWVESGIRKYITQKYYSTVHNNCVHKTNDESIQLRSQNFNTLLQKVHGMDEAAVQALEPILPKCQIESLVVADDGLGALESLVMEFRPQTYFVCIYIE